MVDFQKLRVWQLAHKNTLSIYKLTTLLPNSEIYGLISQIRRAAVSVELNIAESEGRFNKKEKIQFLYTARASAVEVRAVLLIVIDLFPKLASESEANIGEYLSLEMQLNSLIGYRRKSSQPSQSS